MPEVATYENPILIKSGELRLINWSNNIIKDEKGDIKGVLSIGIDVTERQRSEEELRRVNRTLKVLIEFNQVLVRASEEAELLQNTCNIIVVSGGYRLAWIGYAEADAKKTVRPVAQAGSANGYLDIAGITWADEERGHGPTGRAIRTGQSAICKDILSDPDFIPWREAARRCGFASSLALPLNIHDRIIGTLNIYSELADAFDAEEVKLLKELADDLAYGIGALRSHTERMRSAERLTKLNESFLKFGASPLENINHLTALCGEQMGAPVLFMLVSIRICSMPGDTGTCRQTLSLWTNPKVTSVTI